MRAALLVLLLAAFVAGNGDNNLPIKVNLSTLSTKHLNQQLNLAPIY
jgi:hypothetical protein